MKTYKETRTITVSKLRSLCIKNDWYTCGDNDDYEAMFNRLYDNDGCMVNMTTEKIAEVAADIYEHSDITDYTVETVMYEIAKACFSIFEAA